MERYCLSKGSRVSALLLFVIAAILFFFEAPAYSSEQVARLTQFSGTVIVQSKGDWGVKPENDLPLYSMDKVVTRTGTAVVTFSDGAVVEIRPNTNLLIEEQEKEGTSRNLRLLLGKVSFKTGIGSKTRTNLQTPTAVVGLRGTAGILSIGIDGKSYIQFAEGGMSFSVGDFISGVAKDVPAELADLNPAQRAAFVASAAADQAKNASEAVKEGKAPEAQASLASAKAAEAAAVEAKTAAQAMINNPSGEIQQQAKATIQTADKAIEAAKEAEKKAIDAGAKPITGPETYTPPSDTKTPGFDVKPPDSGPPVTIPPTLPPTTAPTTTQTPITTTAPAPTTTLAGFSQGPIQGTLGADSSISVSASLYAGTDQGPMYLSGSYTSLPLAGGGSLGGNLNEGGAFDGYLGGVLGSWRGFFDSVYVNASGDAGFLYSTLSGTAENGILTAAGTLTRSGSYGKIAAGETLASLLLQTNAALDNLKIPNLSSISVDLSGKPTISVADILSEKKGIRLSDGTILGVWEYGLSNNASYSSVYNGTSWSGMYGYSTGPGYLLGQVQGTEERNALLGDLHVAITAGDVGLDYLDPYYKGKVFLDYQGHKLEINNPAASAHVSGGVVLTPLLFSSTLSSLNGSMMQLTNGTYYSSDFQRGQGNGPYDWYDYEYFLRSSDQKLLFGSREYEPLNQPSLNEIYFPDGRYIEVTDYPPWRITNRGTLEKPVSYFTALPGNAQEWRRTWYEERPSNMLAASGTLSGVLGGTKDLSTLWGGGSAAFDILAMYQPPANGGSLFSFLLDSTANTQGAYQGYLAGMLQDQNVAQSLNQDPLTRGLFYGIYVDPDRKAGILKGGFAGSAYPSIAMLEASGTMQAYYMNDVSFNPSELSAKITPGIMFGWLGGRFNNDPTSWIYSGGGHGYSRSIQGENWGVYRMNLGSENFVNNPSNGDSWTAVLGGPGEFGTQLRKEIGQPDYLIPDPGYWLAGNISGSASAGILQTSAPYAGKFLTYSKYGNISGEIIGTYDATAGNWQATSAGYWEKTQPLSFIGIADHSNVRMEVKAHNGNYGSGGAYYNYRYLESVDEGWSQESYDGAVTQTNFRGDDRRDSWTNASGALSYNSGTWSGNLGDVLRTGSHYGPVEPGPAYYNLDYLGWIDGLIGGLDDPWAATAAHPAAIQILGEYRRHYEKPGISSVFDFSFWSYNPYLSNPGQGNRTIWNQADNSVYGAFHGYAGGVIQGNGTDTDIINGNIRAVYLDNGGNAGILKGNFLGSGYRTEMWEATGGLYPIPLVSGLNLDPANFRTKTQDHPEYLIGEESNEGSSNSHGQFRGNLGFYGDIHFRSHSTTVSHVKTTATLQVGGISYDQYFGVRSSLLGGTYSAGGLSDHWVLTTYADEATSRRHAVLLSSADSAVTNGTWSDGLITGKGVGSWVSKSEAVTGLSGGDVKGTYNPDNLTWQMNTLWSYMDTRTFLSLAGTDVGRGNLLNLDIPPISVGVANLMQGAEANNLYEVYMNNVRFYAYRSGGAPRIWATDEVGGKYRDLGPTPNGGAVHLFGNGLDVAFNITQWGGSKWVAAVDGGGWYSSGGSTPLDGRYIEMYGDSAGTYGSGIFSGTGSGTARANPYVSPWLPPSPSYPSLDWMAGTIGGWGDLWGATSTAPANVFLVGGYPESSSDPGFSPFFNFAFFSKNPYLNDNTIGNRLDNANPYGAFRGFAGGAISPNQTSGLDDIAGGLIGIYLDNLGNMGVLNGGFTGSGDPGTALWEAEGVMYPIQLVQNTGIAPAAFYGNTVLWTSSYAPPKTVLPVVQPPDWPVGLPYNEENYWWWASSAPTPSLPEDLGRFGADGLSGSIELKSRDVTSLGVAGQPWSIAQAVTGGIYSGTPTDIWSRKSDFLEGSTRRMTVVEGTKWSDVDKKIEGNIHGAWVNWDNATTGVMGGDLKGTFNPNNFTWQAVSRIASLNTDKFLNLAQERNPDGSLKYDGEGRPVYNLTDNLGAYQQALQGLKIPCIEIGRTDLQGSGNNMSVLMKDTTFFAYRTGEKPRIWATNDVTGSYTGAPAINTTPITLNQVSGRNANVSATFNVQNWNTVNKTWGANVDGSGTVGGNPITFKGAAAGGIDQPAAGQIKGTAAGIAK